MTIHKLNTVAQDGTKHIFIVDETEKDIGGLRGIEFRIYPEWSHRYKAFILDIVFLRERILVYMARNNYYPEVSGKGITKAMIIFLHKKYNMNVVSSTNIDTLKLTPSEGRVDDATRYWEKWQLENPKVSYDRNEDRFTYSI